MTTLHGVFASNWRMWLKTSECSRFGKEPLPSELVELQQLNDESSNRVRSQLLAAGAGSTDPPPTGGISKNLLLSVCPSVCLSVRPSICLSVMLNPLNINCPSAQPTMEPLVQPLFQPSPLPSNVPSLCSAALTLPFSICSVSLQAQAQALQFFHMAPTH